MVRWSPDLTKSIDPWGLWPQRVERPSSDRRRDLPHVEPGGLLERVTTNPRAPRTRRLMSPGVEPGPASAAHGGDRARPRRSQRNHPTEADMVDVATPHPGTRLHRIGLPTRCAPGTTASRTPAARVAAGALEANKAPERRKPPMNIEGLVGSDQCHSSTSSASRVNDSPSEFFILRRHQGVKSRSE